MGPVIVGISEAGVHDAGMSLHGTYGWPILRGATLKGVAHAYARDEECMAAAERAAIFGSPRPGGDEDAAVGGAMFLDALPRRPIRVGLDVLTPHAQPYYRKLEPPAEYAQPIPVPFLVVTGGEWLAFLAGEPDPVRQAARLLAAAVAEIGVGAKTAAGYGYLRGEAIVLGGAPQ
jgi:CRISPR-associated protein Cmr6